MQKATDIIKAWPSLLAFESELKDPHGTISSSTGELRKQADSDNAMRFFLSGFHAGIAEKSSIRSLKAKIASLENDVEILRTEIKTLKESLNLVDLEVIHIRDISYDDAKEEIKQFFIDNHGKKFTAADVETQLGIDFELALQICSDLEGEGQIG